MTSARLVTPLCLSELQTHRSAITFRTRRTALKSEEQPPGK